MPVLTDFLREQPKLTASLVTLDRVANLIEEGFDLALRIAQLPDSTIVARRIGAVRRLLVASPDYLGRHGMPLQPSDLAGHDLIAFEDLFDARRMALRPRWQNPVGRRPASAGGQRCARRNRGSGARRRASPAR